MEVYYHPDILTNQNLPETEAHHCLHVMRHQSGDRIYVTDGRGGLYHSAILSTTKKAVTLQILDKVSRQQRSHYIQIAVAPVKNMERMEFMVEKLTELGVAEILFVKTQRCERDKINIEKLNHRAIAAIKQSRNLYLPQIHSMQGYKEFIEKKHEAECYIAAVVQGETTLYYRLPGVPGKQLILIGPEGDFTSEELQQAVAAHFKPVSLGEFILRTDTAAIVAATLAINKSSTAAFM